MKPIVQSLQADRSPPLWRRLLCGFRKLREQPEWVSFVGKDWADRIMSEIVEDRFHAKQGRTIGRWTLTSRDGRTLVVYLKRHYRLSRLAGLLAFFFPGRSWSPGLQEWEHLLWARQQGLPVPNALAAGELVGTGGKLESFLAVEELQGMLALHEAIPLAQSQLDPAIFRRWKESLAIELARLAHVMHDKRAFHKDLYLCHFYIRATDMTHLPTTWFNRVTVIDLHRLGRHRFTALWRKAKDLSQLLYSSEVPGVTVRDRLAFWRAYRRGGRRRLLAFLIRLKWKRYRRHNLKKR